MNCKYYAYTAFGGRHACCDDVCRFDGECLYNCWLVTSELNVISLYTGLALLFCTNTRSGDLPDELM